MGSNSSKVNENYSRETLQGENINRRRNILCPTCREHIIAQIRNNSSGVKTQDECITDKRRESTALNKNEKKIYHSESMELRNGKKIVKNLRKLRKRKAKKPQFDNRKKKYNRRTFDEAQHYQLTIEPINRKGILKIKREQEDHKFSRDSDQFLSHHADRLAISSIAGTSGLQSTAVSTQCDTIKKTNDNQKIKKSKQVRITIPIVNKSPCEEEIDQNQQHIDNIVSLLPKCGKSGQIEGKRPRKSRFTKRYSSHQSIEERAPTPPYTSYIS